MQAAVVLGGSRGVGFQIKMLAAFVVLPTFYLVLFGGGAGSSWLRGSGTSPRRPVVVAVVSLSWAIARRTDPKDQRPYIGGSRNNSALELALGYNGLGRCSGIGEFARHGPARWSRAGRAPSPRPTANSRPPQPTNADRRRTPGDDEAAPLGRDEPGEVFPLRWGPPRGGPPGLGPGGLPGGGPPGSGPGRTSRRRPPGLVARRASAVHPRVAGRPDHLAVPLAVVGAVQWPRLVP